jgi:predicted RNase H-like HicB family nuclease
MQKFTFPIIFIFNEESNLHNGYIPDLAIFSEGQSPEEVYAEMEIILENYMFLAVKYGTEIPAASTLDATVKKWPGFKVSLISAEIK